jgi:alkane 1-monooxygenase
MNQGPGHPETARLTAVLRFFLIYLVTGSAFVVGLKGGWFTFFAPLGMTFVLVPIVDVLMGLNPRDAPEETPRLAVRVVLRLATGLAIPAQVGVMLWGAWVVARSGAGPVEFAGVILSAGIMGGVVGITVAHELMHRSNNFDRVLAGILLTTVSYLHWMVEHIAGHHRRVATHQDPATARLGEPLPRFLVRSIVGTYRSAWAIEVARLKRPERRLLPVLRNRVLWYSLAPAGVAVVLGAVLGPLAVVYFVGQSLVAISFLEIINYIEHYGLERRQIRPGVYERVTPLHSWNASHRFTNALLFNLQRHSDHHVWPQRPYHTLRHHTESPQLPLGYAGMALVALWPPLWRRVMDPRVAAHRAHLSATMIDEPMDGSPPEPELLAAAAASPSR